MGKVRSLKCRGCGEEYPPIQIYACEKCFAPLEAVYDCDSLRLSKADIHKRIKTLWRYFELLPVADKEKIVDIGAGYTALRRCNQLAEEIGLKTLYVKDDTTNPTNSFKDRPASVAVSKALEFGIKAIGCPSTGNLCAAIAAHAAVANLPCYVFLPADTEQEKIAQTIAYGAKVILVKGTYDEANRLAAQAMEEYNWSMANISLRPYYAEGSKTLAFEICEQLGWRAPDHIIVPTASGGLLYATWKALRELEGTGLIEGTETSITCAQPEGCSPIVKAFRLGETRVRPIEHPSTIAKSLAIGNPGDGDYALEMVRRSGGTAESATDDEIIEAIKLLARKEGLFAEPAGAVTVAVLKKLVDKGEISRDEEVVCLVTGSGLKSTKTILDIREKPIEIEPTLEALRKAIA